MRLMTVRDRFFVQVRNWNKNDATETHFQAQKDQYKAVLYQTCWSWQKIVFHGKFCIFHGIVYSVKFLSYGFAFQNEQNFH